MIIIEIKIKKIKNDNNRNNNEGPLLDSTLHKHSIQKAICDFCCYFSLFFIYYCFDFYSYFVIMSILVNFIFIIINSPK